MSTTVDPETTEQAPVTAPDETAPVAEETLACPSCGAPADPGQLMCLECGSRLALDYQRPPSWRVPAAIAGVVVLLAGAGLAFALARVSSDAGKTTANQPTQPVANAAPADTPPTTSQPAPAPASSTPAPAPAPTSTTATPAPAPTSGGWPAGKSAFTVILASLPSQSAAQARAKDAQAAGITGAAVLHSDDFPTLNKGYWVVFDGQYDAIAQAQDEAKQDRAKPGFTDAYPRFVSKDANAKP